MLGNLTRSFTNTNQSLKGDRAMRGYPKYAVFETLENRRLLSSTFTITGFVYKDANQDGIYDKGDAPIAGRTVYLDTTNSGKYVSGDPATKTNAAGDFSFTLQKAGVYFVHDENPAGTAVLTPAGGLAKVTLSTTATKAAATFGEIALPYTHGAISGTLFYDAAGAGVYKAGDAPVAGRTLYIDLGNKGSFVSGDPQAITSSTGSFVFSNLKVGAYIIREQAPAGRALDVPAAGYASATISLTAPKATLLIGEKAVPTLNYVGEYEQYYNNALIVVDVRPVGSVIGNYSGDIWSDGEDLKFTATESAANALAGHATGNGQTVAFNATLSGKTLTVSYPTLGGKDVLTLVDPTPAPTPPSLYSYTGSIFNYVKPSNWNVTENSYGILITSPDGMQQVGFIGSVANGEYGINDVAQAEANAGARFLHTTVLKDGYVSSTEYVQAGEAVLTFVHNGVTYGSAQLIETFNFATGPSSVVTLTEIYEVTAPKAQWVADSPTLIFMLGSIALHPSTAIATAAKRQITPFLSYGLGFYDPGVYGDWSSSGGFDYSSDPYLYDEQSSLAYSSSSFDTECDNFDSYILS